MRSIIEKNVDALGRIVIPASIRKNLKLEQDTLMEIEVLDNKIVLSKANVINDKSNEILLKILKNLVNNEILITSLSIVVNSTKKELINQKLSNSFLELLNKRKKEQIDTLQIVMNNNLNNSFLFYPILKNSILYGSVVIFSKDIHNDQNNSLIDSIIDLYLETYI